MAYRKLAVILNNTSASPSRIATAATMAFHHRERLTPLERDLAEAFYYYRGAEFDRAKVESAYRATLELDPENFTALNNLALTLNEERRFAEAESLALRGIAAAPSAAVYLNAVTAQIGEGKWGDAIRTVAALAARAPKNPMTFFLRVRIADAQRDFAGAAEVAQEDARDPRDPAIREFAASVLASLSLVRGKMSEAESQLHAAMDLAEERHLPGSYVGHAVSLGTMQLRDKDGARVGLHSVQAALQRHPLASFPAEDRPYLGLAWLYAEVGQPDRAKQVLAEYAAAVPEAFRLRAPFRHGAAAAVAYAEGRVRDAIREYRAWYEEDSCAVCGLFYLGRAYERMGEVDSALVVYTRAINTPGMYRAAEEAATLAETYRRLGELYEERGDRAKARDYYGRFTDLWKSADPELQPAVRDVRRRLAHLLAEP
jgi:tetratricopeptide (TPR) repeat protein